MSSACARAPDPYGSENVYLTDADGGDRRVLADNARLAGWSPDGVLLAIVAGGTKPEAVESGATDFGPPVLEVVRPDGGGRRVLRRYASGMNVTASWSPNSRALAVHSYPWEGVPQRSLISLVDAAGNRAERVVFARNQDVVVEGAPAWSPNGRRIAFAGHDGPPAGGDSFFPPGLLVASLANGAVRAPLPAASGEVAPFWMPDGRSLVVSAWDENRDTYSRLQEVTLDGRRRTLVDDTRGAAAITADGRRLAVPVWLGSDGGDQRPGVVIIPPPGGARATVEIDAHILAWSSDGSRLAAAGPDGVFLLSSDGSDRRLVAGPDPPHAVTGLSWSPDGRRLAFSLYHQGYLPDE